jgi:hypothetical protein
LLKIAKKLQPYGFKISFYNIVLLIFDSLSNTLNLPIAVKDLLLIGIIKKMG